MTVLSRFLRGASHNVAIRRRGRGQNERPLKFIRVFEHLEGRNLPTTISPTSAAFVNGAQLAEVADIAQPSLRDLFESTTDAKLAENQFNDSTHTSSGTTTIDETPPLAPRASIAAYSDGESINLFAVGDDGHIVWDQLYNGAWTGFSDIGTSFSFTSGEVVAAQAQSGVLNLFAIGTDGVMKQYQYVTSEAAWHAYNFSANIQATAGTPLSVWYDGSNGILDLYGQLSDGNVGQWQYVPSSGWAEGEISTSGLSLPLPGSNPGVPLAVTQANSQINIFAVNTNGSIAQMQWTSSAGWHRDVISAGSAGFASGQPISVNDDSNGVTTIVGANSNGDIGEVQWTPSSGWNVYVVEVSYYFTPNSQVTLIVSPSGEFEILGFENPGDLMLDEEHVTAWDEYELD